MSTKCNFELDKETCSSSIEIEKPIFSPNQTRRFIIDGIIDIYSIKHCGADNKNINTFHTKSFSGKELHIINGSIYRKCIYDGKPLLNSISSVIGQLKSYSYFLKYHRWECGVRSEQLSNPKMVILTFDVNNDFDELCQSQYHIVKFNNLVMETSVAAAIRGSR
jgi:hypothetical protein